MGDSIERPVRDRSCSVLIPHCYGFWLFHQHGVAGVGSGYPPVLPIPILLEESGQDEQKGASESVLPARDWLLPAQHPGGIACGGVGALTGDIHHTRALVHPAQQDHVWDQDSSRCLEKNCFTSFRLVADSHKLPCNLLVCD